MHRICDHSPLLERTRETARTEAADHSTLDGLQGTRDTRTGGLKPPDLRVMRVRTPPRARSYQDELASAVTTMVGGSRPPFRVRGLF